MSILESIPVDILVNIIQYSEAESILIWSILNKYFNCIMKNKENIKCWIIKEKLEKYYPYDKNLIECLQTLAFKLFFELPIKKGNEILIHGLLSGRKNSIMRCNLLYYTNRKQVFIS